MLFDFLDCNRDILNHKEIRGCGLWRISKVLGNLLGEDVIKKITNPKKQRIVVFSGFDKPFLRIERKKPITNIHTIRYSDVSMTIDTKRRTFTIQRIVPHYRLEAVVSASGVAVSHAIPLISPREMTFPNHNPCDLEELKRINLGQPIGIDISVEFISKTPKKTGVVNDFVRVFNELLQ